MDKYEMTGTVKNLNVAFTKTPLSMHNPLRHLETKSRSKPAVPFRGQLSELIRISN